MSGHDGHHRLRLGRVKGKNQNETTGGRPIRWGLRGQGDAAADNDDAHNDPYELSDDEEMVKR